MNVDLYLSVVGFVLLGIIDLAFATHRHTNVFGISEIFLNASNIHTEIFI